MREKFGDEFWGFWMLGGMSGGGMGFIVRSGRAKPKRRSGCRTTMSATKARICSMPCRSPWSRSCTISRSTNAAPGPTLLSGDAAVMSNRYYSHTVPNWLRADRKTSLDDDPPRTGTVWHRQPHLARRRGHLRPLMDRMLPHVASGAGEGASLQDLLGQLRLRSGTARADPRRSQSRPDWSRAEPSLRRRAD